MALPPALSFLPHLPDPRHCLRFISCQSFARNYPRPSHSSSPPFPFVSADALRGGRGLSSALAPGPTRSTASFSSPSFSSFCSLPSISCSSSLVSSPSSSPSFSSSASPFFSSSSSSPPSPSSSSSFPSSPSSSPSSSRSFSPPPSSSSPSPTPSLLAPAPLPAHILYPRFSSSTPSSAPHIALTDRFGRHHDYLRLSLTERCNFRCQYCMPEQGVPLSPPPNLLTRPEIVTICRVFAKAGVRKIRLTGGEPLLRRDLGSLLYDLRDIPGIRTLGLTTNGLLLSRHLQDLRHAQVNALNISLDSLRPDRFALMTRRPAFHRVWDALELVVAESFCQVKVNCVVMNGFNEDEIVDFARLSMELPLHIRFIEFMPFAQNGWSPAKLFSRASILDKLKNEFGTDLLRVGATKGRKAEEEMEREAARGSRAEEGREGEGARGRSAEEGMEGEEARGSEEKEGRVNVRESKSNDKPRERSDNGSEGPSTETTSDLYQIRGGVGYIGIIASMTHKFCSSCNRIRVTADGSIKNCLFGTEEFPLRDVIRKYQAEAKDGGGEEAVEEEVLRVLEEALRKKRKAHGGMMFLHDNEDQNRHMVKIGG